MVDNAERQNDGEVQDRSDTVLEQVKQLAAKLFPAERAHLVEWLEATLSDESGAPAPTAPRHSLYGLCADLCPGPTDKDIEGVRREMWSNFPHEDIA
jgi:hypothetical protein